jgi:hypothetical protein
VDEEKINKNKKEYFVSKKNPFFINGSINGKEYP